MKTILSLIAFYLVMVLSLAGCGQHDPDYWKDKRSVLVLTTDQGWKLNCELSDPAYKEALPELCRVKP